MARALPLWDSKIKPDLLAGRNVMVVAHGNSLRGLVKHIDGISDDEITKLDLGYCSLQGALCMFSSTKQSRETTRMPTGRTYTKQKVLSQTCAHFSQVPFPRRSAT